MSFVRTAGFSGNFPLVDDAPLSPSENNARFFPYFARWCEQQVARPAASLAALLFVALWLAAGPLYGWSSSWQLIINTTSSVITLIMVFMIQNTQRRDTQAIQLKLDELIRVNSEARNELISLEAKPETEVEEVRSAFDELRATVKRDCAPRDGR
jgi:low affinity Fe/Cu permease